MNELTQPIATPIVNNDPYSPMQIMLNDTLFNQCYRLAQIMASGVCTVPKHLQGNVGDCFAIIGQALRWGFDPYAVAQKTHLISGVLGYEAQLIIAVINAKAPIVGRLKFDYFGDWSKVKSKEDKPDDVGVVVSAIMKGDDDYTSLSISMAQVGTVQNSPLWTTDPRQQLSYLAAKRWARLHCPDVILGLYSADELEAREEPKNVTPTSTPTKKNSGTQSLKQRAKDKLAQPQDNVQATVAEFVEHYDISDLIEKINQIDAVQKIAPIGQEIAAMIDNPDIHFHEEDLTKLRQKLKDKKAELIYQNLMDAVKSATYQEFRKFEQMIQDKQSEIGEARVNTLMMVLNEVVNR